MVAAQQSSQTRLKQEDEGLQKEGPIEKKRD